MYTKWVDRAVWRSVAGLYATQRYFFTEFDIYRMNPKSGIVRIPLSSFVFISFFRFSLCFSIRLIVFTFFYQQIFNEK